MTKGNQPSPGKAQESWVPLPPSRRQSVGAYERVMLAMAATACIFLPILSAVIGAILSLGENDHTHTFWAVGVGLGAVIVGLAQAATTFWARSFIRRDWVDRLGIIRARRFIIALAVLAATAMLSFLVAGVAFGLGFVVTAFFVLDFLCVAFPSMTAIGRVQQVNKLSNQQQATSSATPFQPYQF